MRKSLPIAALGVVLVAIVCVSCYADPRANHFPIWRVLLAWPDGVATLAVVVTLFFIAWQAILMRQAVSDSQNASKRELRAYLTVVIGRAVYQERRPPNKGGDLRFQCNPLIVNTGQTPARNIVFKVQAAILPNPLPKDKHLPDTPDAGAGTSILGAKQNAEMNAVVDGFCADKDVKDIKSAAGDQALYTWGRITYEDVFGDKHSTLFCQHIYWDRKNNVRGLYIPGRNDAD